tara:strand:- start:195 stop:323 length:129 start_codon:yes stop_codon:yes gene_type:complete
MMAESADGEKPSQSDWKEKKDEKVGVKKQCLIQILKLHVKIF